MPIRTGGVVGSRVVPNGVDAVGVWQLGEVEASRRAKIWPYPNPDSSFASVSLLLPLTGVNNTTTFRDLSNNNFTVTRFGDAKISTAQSKFGDLGSLYLDGTGDYLSVPSDAAFSLTGNFTVEWWSYGASYGRVISRWNAGSALGWLAAIDATTLTWGEANNGTFIAARTFAISTPSSTAWHHVAFCRSGTSLRAFFNGTQVGSTITTSSNHTPAVSTATTIGQSENAGYVTGYLSNVRVTKAARYTGAFTPSTIPFGSPNT